MHLKMDINIITDLGVRSSPETLCTYKEVVIHNITGIHYSLVTLHIVALAAVLQIRGLIDKF